MSDTPDVDEIPIARFAPRILPPRAPSSGLAGLALLLPVLAIAVLFLVQSWLATVIVGIAMVVVTSLLLWIDARMLGVVDRSGQQRSPPGLLLAAMLVFWAVFYPMVYFRRQRFCRPNLGPVALLVMFVYLAASVTRALLQPYELPECNSPEVAQLLDKVLRSSPMGSIVKSVTNPREVAFDPAAGQRRGLCTVTTTSGSTITVEFVVEWLDRGSGQFQLRTIERQ